MLNSPTPFHPPSGLSGTVPSTQFNTVSPTLRPVRHCALHPVQHRFTHPRACQALCPPPSSTPFHPPSGLSGTVPSTQFPQPSSPELTARSALQCLSSQFHFSSKLQLIDSPSPSAQHQTMMQMIHKHIHVQHWVSVQHQTIMQMIHKHIHVQHWVSVQHHLFLPQNMWSLPIS